MARLGVFLLLSCVLLQHTFADPRPEFGSIGTVQSSLTIKNTVESITPLLQAIDDKNLLVLKTDYQLLSEVLPLMASLGTNVTVLGPKITSAIVAGVPKADGNYTGVFEPIFTSISTFKQFIDTEVNATRGILKGRLGNDIDVLFGDGFGNMRIALVQVENALQRLRSALATATVRNGRAQIDPAIPVDVLVSVSFLKATVSPVEYIVHSTIENLEYADNFIYDLEQMNVSFRSDLVFYTTEFNNSLTSTGELLKMEVTNVTSAWGIVASKLPNATSTMSSLPEYNETASALSNFSTTFSALSSFPAKVANGIATYINTSNTYLAQYTDVLVPKSYESINYLIEVLIAGGANARFCFFKHSPLLVNYYALLVSDVEVCFNLESFRLSNLVDVAKSVGRIILFDVDDLIDNLATCNTKPSPARCIAAIGPYYLALTEKTQAKWNLLLKYGTADGKASLQRLGSCIITNRLKNQQALITAVDDVKRCHDLGPEEPN